jgi:hypothetical protein
MPPPSAQNGRHSTGVKTKEGKLSILTANVSNGSRCWLPVLPTESEEAWNHRLEEVKKSLKPGSYLEEQLAGQVALVLQQWDRLHRFEKVKTVHEMRESVDDPFSGHGEHGEAALALLETGISTTREQLTRVERLKTLLEFLPMADPHKPLNDADGRLILESAISLCAKRTNGTAPFNEPQTWTWGTVIEGLAELASDCRKSPESLYEAVCTLAQTEYQRFLVMLKEGLAILERRLVHNGTALTNEYHTRVLGRLAKLLALYGQAQAARLGLNIVQPDLELPCSNGNGDEP